jgi:hypothetical protein
MNIKRNSGIYIGVATTDGHFISGVLSLTQRKKQTGLHQK